MLLSPSRSRRRAIGWLCTKSKIRRLNNSRHRIQIALLQTETLSTFNRLAISPLNEAVPRKTPRVCRCLLCHGNQNSALGPDREFSETAQPVHPLPANSYHCTPSLSQN